MQMQKPLVRGLSALTALCTLVSAAWADLKVEYEVTIKGIPTVPGAPAATPKDAEKPLAMTSYYKGDMVRMDYADTSSVTDFKAGTVTTYNLKSKTFYVTKNVDGSIPGADAGQMAMLSSLKAEVKGDVKPGGANKELVGKGVKNYLYNATIKLTVPEDAGFPVPAEMLPTLVFKGENWVTEAVQPPAHYSANLPGLPGAGMMSMFGDGMKEFVGKLQAIPGFPLKTVLTIETILSPSALAFIGDGQAPQPMTISTEVKSLSEAPLEDSLFGPRAGFKEGQAPKPQSPFGGSDAAPGGGGTAPPAKP